MQWSKHIVDSVTNENYSKLKKEAAQNVRLYCLSPVVVLYDSAVALKRLVS